MNTSQSAAQIVHNHIESILPQLQHEATGRLPFPTLSVGFGKTYNGFIYCWDNHHMTLRFAAAGQPEQLKYFVGNMLACQNESDFVPSIVHFKNAGIGQLGPWHAQPWLAQNVATYFDLTGDAAWTRQIFPNLSRYLDFWIKQHAAPHGLYRWRHSWHSGFDNEISGTIFQPDAVLSPDLNAYLYLELRAMAFLSEALGQTDSVETYSQKADQLRDAINDRLWDDTLGTYAAYDLINNQPRVSLELAKNNTGGDTEDGIGRYAYLSCPALLPLFAGIATPDRAERMIRAYVLAPEHFRSSFGIRSLSKASEYYNQARWGAPSRFSDPRILTNSNWQGPVWIPLNWFVFHALLRYGFASDAQALVADTEKVLASCISRLGYMRENFDAETGEGLYADRFGSWNILADIMGDFLPGRKAPIRLFPWE
ncbi:MAG: trehalase family glycosidase [Verrucomicrobiota bacterium]